MTDEEKGCEVKAQVTWVCGGHFASTPQINPG
jgi:hypothetical protein